MKAAREKGEREPGIHFPRRPLKVLGNKEFGFEKQKEDLRVGHGASESEREGQRVSQLLGRVCTSGAALEV